MNFTIRASISTFKTKDLIVFSIHRHINGLSPSIWSLLGFFLHLFCRNNVYFKGFLVKQTNNDFSPLAYITEDALMSWKGQPGLIASWPTLVWPWNMIWNIYVAGMHFQNSSTALILTLRCKNSFAETLKEPQTTGLVPVFFVSLSKSKREIIIISQFDCFPSAARGDTEKKKAFL